MHCGGAEKAPAWQHNVKQACAISEHRGKTHVSAITSAPKPSPAVLYYFSLRRTVGFVFFFFYLVNTKAQLLLWPEMEQQWLVGYGGARNMYERSNLGLLSFSLHRDGSLETRSLVESQWSNDPPHS